MTLHPPFVITPRLCPGIQISTNIWISLEQIEVSATDDDRDRAHFVIDFPNGVVHEDREMKSGCGGFRSEVEAFEGFLGFLGAALDAYCNGGDPADRDSNASLFPHHVLDLLADYKEEIAWVCMELTDEEGRGIVRHELIEG